MDEVSLAVLIGAATIILTALASWTIGLLRYERERRHREVAEERERRDQTFREMREVQQQLHDTRLEMRAAAEQERERAERMRAERVQRLRDQVARATSRPLFEDRQSDRELLDRAADELLDHIYDEQMVAVALARAYAHPDNSAKVVDPTLINVMAAEVVAMARQGRPAGAMTATQRNNAALHEVLTEGPAPEGFNELEVYMRRWVTTMEADEDPDLVATIDGVPVFNADFLFASRENVDVRWAIGMRWMMLRYFLNQPALARMSREAVSKVLALEPGERNLEV